MTAFIVQRALTSMLVVFGVSVVTFFLTFLSGDPAELMLPTGATPEQMAAFRREWGFDDPIYVQYATTMQKVFSGDLISYANQTNVIEEIKRGIPRTFALAIGAALLWFAMGVALGLYTAIRAGRFSDRLVTVLALVGVSMPVFWLGALASYYLGYKAGLFPNGGYAEIGEDGLWEWVRHMILPWVVLATLFIGVYSRVLRSNVLDTINDDYVRTARAKGLSERTVIFKHGLRSALTPIVTLLGLDVGILLGGAILTETVFNIQGIGRFAYDAIVRFDLPVIQGTVLFGAFFIVIMSLFVDILYAFIDPRVRYG